jgi:hypothetical protein
VVLKTTLAASSSQDKSISEINSTKFNHSATVQWVFLISCASKSKASSHCLVLANTHQNSTALNFISALSFFSEYSAVLPVDSTTHSLRASSNKAALFPSSAISANLLVSSSLFTRARKANVIADNLHGSAICILKLN